MPPYSVPRPSLAPRRGPGGGPRPEINWRRGLLRLWLVVSAAWIMGWIIYLMLLGIQGQLKTTSDFLELPVLLFGPPVALLVFGLAAGWAFRGFAIEVPPPERDEDEP